MTWDEVAAVGLALEGVERSTSYGTPALKRKGKLMVRLWEDGEVVVLKGIGFDQREMLMAADPAVFFVTPHYQAYDCVLARLAAAEPDALSGLVRQIWTQLGPRRRGAE